MCHTWHRSTWHWKLIWKFLFSRASNLYISERIPLGFTSRNTNRKHIWSVELNQQILAQVTLKGPVQVIHILNLISQEVALGHMLNTNMKTHGVQHNRLTVHSCKRWPTDQTLKLLSMRWWQYNVNKTDKGYCKLCLHYDICLKVFTCCLPRSMTVWKSACNSWS